MSLQDELRLLHEENDRLKSLLTHHGIAWQKPATPCKEQPASPTSLLSTSDKISLYCSLFRGRTDVYPKRWESTKGKSGYSPACRNEWKPGVCQKPTIKCSSCNQRLFMPTTDQVFYEHLSGKQTIGIYPLLTNDSCYFLAIDFDKADWQEDALAITRSCHELAIPASFEISRSGNGAHIWIFFAEPIPARQARQLGTALISYTCENNRTVSLSSYDRLFPNQDTLPKGGFGNLISLPLQKDPRQRGHSVFVDEELQPYPNQWAYLASIRKLSKAEVEAAILRASGGHHPLDVSFTSSEDDGNPWQRPITEPVMISGPLPKSLKIVQANQIFIEKENLTQPLTNRLIRLAAFQNPEFYKSQAMRMSVWNKPRIICCAENLPKYLALPRGCLETVLATLRDNKIKPELQDERLSGNSITARFTGKLRKDQQTAVQKTLLHETGVLCAPTAFGKTVVAAKIISKRKVSTLILVHRTDLLRQWEERLGTFLDLSKDGLGAIGGGRKKLSGKIDIGVLQSLSRSEKLEELLDNYGQIIVDECHHLSAFSFEAILKIAKARFILGLTATPVRRDGHQPIIFMQCGPIRYVASKIQSKPMQMEVWPRLLSASLIQPDLPIQETFRLLVSDATRNQRIVEDAITSYQEGRKVLVLTERTNHLELLSKALEGKVENYFVLHGRLSKKKREDVFAKLNALAGSTPRVLLATGRLVGEGFDHPPLDTLVLAMPISWKGTLQQYAGRLHREHTGKKDVKIYDYAEVDNPQLARMWNKRQRGYLAMGYEIKKAE